MRIEPTKRKKNTICATVSPYIKKQVDELVASGDFSSMSDLVSIAISEFIGRYNREQKEKAAELSESLPSSKNEQPIIINHIDE